MRKDSVKDTVNSDQRNDEFRFPTIDEMKACGEEDVRCVCCHTVFKQKEINCPSCGYRYSMYDAI